MIQGETILSLALYLPEYLKFNNYTKKVYYFAEMESLWSNKTSYVTWFPAKQNIINPVPEMPSPLLTPHQML